MAAKPTVGIVRHQQFRPSETFIANQARALRSFHPLFVGRDRVPTKDRTDAVSVAAFGKRAVLSYTLGRRSRRLRDVLAARQTVLLHAHFGVEGVYAAPLAKALGVPLVTTLHGFDVTMTKARLLTSRKPSWINYVTWRRALFEEGALFVCVSEHIRRRAVEWGYPPDRLVVLPVGVDVEAIQPVAHVRRPRIVHVARLVEKKGTADLLRAFAAVHKAVPGAELIIVGDGPLRASLEALTRELGVASSVRFRGVQPHDETLRLLAEARLLCVPSVTASNGDQEGLPTVVLEAAASAKPVVGTDHGGIPEAVVDGSTGYIVPERDHAALADRLRALLTDVRMCERFGLAGRDLVVERFNLRRQTDRLESLYWELI